jgi:two-component system, NtrC family, sensor kinase
LNLITNAFYTVHEKKKSNGADFQPAVTISTRKFTDHITIAVKDNGNGIPQQDLDKIFQPFFTTKPTGEGTGLGLSLSYDIVKVHGGEIKLESEINEGTVFTILLPISTE